MTILGIEKDTDTVIMSNGLGGDRYITPEYLAPLPQKDGSSDKSPLQMLAQTCSQIGADSGSKLASDKLKLTASTVTSTKTSASTRSSPSIVVSDSKQVPFKPYENTKEVSAKAVDSKRISDTGSSKSESPHMISRSPKESDVEMFRNSNGAGSKSISPKQSSTSESSSTTPIMSSGLEILAGHPKDIPLGTFRPPGPSLLDLNPAFRLPSNIPGYPACSPSSAGNGSVCRDPYCKDPGCPTAVYNAYVSSMSSSRMRLPLGYMELMEAHKLASMGSATSVPPTSLSASASLGPGGPYICNWMNGRDYCGKRYSSAEELLVHLKTHTNLSTSDMASSQAAAASAGYAGLLSHPLMRGVPGQLMPSPMSLQAHRYSPYQRPGSTAVPPSLSSLASLPPSPVSPLGALPPSLASLHSASLYASLYGGRL